MLTPIKRVISYGIKNFKRQKSLNFATIFVLFIALTIFTSLFLFKSSMKFLVTEIKNKVDISIYLQEEMPTEKIEEIKAQLVALDEVESVEYVNSAEAVARFKERHKNDPLILQSLEVVGENPFYPAFNIKAKSPGQYAAIIAFLDRDIFDNVVHKIDYAQKKTLIEKIFGIVNNLNLFGALVICLLAAVAILITFNTIRIAIKDAGEEIGVMRLVGASNWYIRGPFIVQGALCGILAALITFFVFFVVSYFSAPKVMAMTNGFNVFGWFSANAPAIFFLQLASAIGLSVISSLIAIRKHLQV